MIYISTGRLGKGIAYLFTFLILFQTSSCTFFNYDTVVNDFDLELKRANRMLKRVFIHSNEGVFNLRYAEVDSVILSGNLVYVSPDIDEKPYYYTEGRSYRVRKGRGEMDIMKEVHIYMNENATSISEGKASININEIIELKVMKFDKTKSTVGTFGVVLLATVGVIGLFIALVAALKTSCPYVYVFNGEDFELQGEVFGGAIGKNLMRDDYMPLPSLKSDEEKYNIRIANELKEKQHIDLANLLVVDHDKDESVILSKDGVPYLIESPQKAVKAYTYSGSNVKDLIDTKDDTPYFFNDQEHSENAVILKFEKDTQSNKGKLLLRAKNSFWAEYIAGKFFEKFGSSFDTWMKQRESIPGDKRFGKMLDNHIPLSVYLKKNGEWEWVDFAYTVGPLAYRDLIIPIDLQEIEGKTVEVKVETGFMFWELDYAAMDFSQERELEMIRLQPTMSKSTSSDNSLEELAKRDDVFLYQNEVGDYVELSFDVPAKEKESSRSVFLHTRGYYHMIRDYEGAPNLAALNRFRSDGFLSEYSRAGYIRVLEYPNMLADK